MNFFLLQEQLPKQEYIQDIKLTDIANTNKFKLNFINAVEQCKLSNFKGDSVEDDIVFMGKLGAHIFDIGVQKGLNGRLIFGIGKFLNIYPSIDILLFGETGDGCSSGNFGAQAFVWLGYGIGITVQLSLYIFNPQNSSIIPSFNLSAGAARSTKDGVLSVIIGTQSKRLSDFNYSTIPPKSNVLFTGCIIKNSAVTVPAYYHITIGWHQYGKNIFKNIFK